MKFQKILMAVASAAMTFGPVASTSVFAKTVDPAAPDSQSTTLHYQVGSHYTWEIHTDIDFGKDKGVKKTDVNGVVKTGEQKVKVDGMIVAKQITLQEMRAKCKHFNKWITQLERL